MMTTTKREIAETFGVTKQTVANRIRELGLEDHVTRAGQIDVIDDAGAAILADNLQKSTGKRELRTPVEEVPRDVVIDTLTRRISELEADRDRLSQELEAERERHSTAEADLRAQLANAMTVNANFTDKIDDFTSKFAEIARNQQLLASTPWWRRGRLAQKLLMSPTD